MSHTSVSADSSGGRSNLWPHEPVQVSTKLLLSHTAVQFDTVIGQKADANRERTDKLFRYSFIHSFMYKSQPYITITNGW